MKILHIIPYVPAPPTFGGALRIYHLLKHIYENHDLTIAGYSDNGNLLKLKDDFPQVKDEMFFLERPFIKKFKRFMQVYSLLTNHSNWYNTTSSARFQNMLDDLVEKNDFDLVQFEFPALCQFQINSDAKTVLDAHNVEYDNFRRMYEMEKSLFRKYFYKKEFQKFNNEEIELASQRDAIFTTSERDMGIFKSHLPDKQMHVIPNGVDTDFFAPGTVQTEPHSLVFTGMMGYVPNYEGINFFIDSVLPIIHKEIPNIKLYVVGKNPPASVKNRASDNIVVTGFVDDVRPYVHRSSVFVVPLRMGGGTRLKVLEALAMKKPVVTTSIGKEGLEVEDNEHVLVADEAEYFAECVLKLLKDQKEAKRLSESGYKRVHEYYNWDAIGERMENAYSTIMSAKTTKPSSKRKLQKTEV